MLKKFKSQIYPVLSKSISLESYCCISFQNIDKKFANFDLRTFYGLENYVGKVLTIHSATVAEGGYGEVRNLYDNSVHFTKTEEEPRNIHLGVDLWAKALTPIFAPLDGKIHSQKYNDNHLDYGATIITEHFFDNKTFFILFGHLSLKSLQNRKVGETFNAGEQLATLGIPEENGGWPSHLHLQIINNIGDWVGDYPGVAKKSEAKFYLKNSPNPNFLIHPDKY